MKPLMAENQRREILSALPNHGRMLEWGVGGTTRWLLDRMKPTQSLVTVEHAGPWAVESRGECGAFKNWTLIHSPGNAGQNATTAEEIPAGLDSYILPVPIDEMETFDVFLIDGVARGACLCNVLLHGARGSRVFVHDLQRDWYSWAIKLGAMRLVGERLMEPEPGGYPALLWRAVLA